VIEEGRDWTGGALKRKKGQKVSATPEETREEVGTDGVSVATTLRPLTFFEPLFAVTSSELEECRSTCMSVGVEGVLPPPDEDPVLSCGVCGTAATV